MENSTNYSLLLLHNVHDAILKEFGYDLTPRQLGVMINRQPKVIVKELVDSLGQETALGNLLDNIAKITTGGMQCPRPQDDKKYKVRYKLAIDKHKLKYFKPILSI